MSRRKAIQDMIKSLSFVGLGGIVWGTYSKKVQSADFVLRPPGAKEEKIFGKTCIKCGECVNVCPPEALKLSTLIDEGPVGNPYFTPRQQPCIMCEDIPCVEICPTDALDENILKTENKLDINKAQMGIAIVDKNACVAFWGIQCDACYRVCPLIDKAITIESDKSKFTEKHSRMLPVINPDYCTGCGMCEHACITEKASIIILPKEVALGKVGDHYIKAYENNKKAIEFDTQKDLNKDEKKALDYLNSDDLLDESDE